MIPIVDSLAHPTLSGQWLDKKVDAGFESLVTSMGKSGFSRACAIGMAGVEGYTHELFIEQCKLHDCLIPIAGIDPNRYMPLKKEMDMIADLGFRGVKIHPRFSGWTRKLDQLQDLFFEAAARNLVVFYCTYMHCNVNEYPSIDPFFSLVELLQGSPATKVVLVHGGDINLMKYAELVRFNDQLLLDLSLTFMKYHGSSLDLDISFLFREFDRRICIGTDFPEYTHHDVRARFDEFSRGVGTDKLENIGHINLERFLGPA